MREVRFGGKLEQGDFICVSYQNCLSFGWYIGNGLNNSLQYYDWEMPAYYKRNYINKKIRKSYINTVGNWRVCKISPRDIFTKPEDITKFEESREKLINLKFIKQ